MAEMKKMVGVRFLPALMAVAVACLIGAGFVVLFLGRATPTNANQARLINELVALSQKIPTQAALALSGNEAAFDELEKARERYSQLAEKLGPQVQGLSA